MPLVPKSVTRGDTLVEVLFATAVFSLVAVGCLSIMNQGTATAQRALEINLVRNEIDAQAEALRFMNASYIAAFQSDPSYLYDSSTPAGQWKLMQSDGDVMKTEDVSKFANDGLKCPEAGDISRGFILNARKARYIKPSASTRPTHAVTFSQVNYDASDDYKSAEGIWIEAVKNWPSTAGQDKVGYVDFHIRACWDSQGQSMPVTLGTIVRLYEPHI